MTYFNMIQLIESSGIGLVYGLRFYGTGQLKEADVGMHILLLEGVLLGGVCH